MHMHLPIYGHKQHCTKVD